MLSCILRIILQNTEKHWKAAQKMKFSIKYFNSKCDQIRNFLRI